jgi:hypothetical protein
MSIQAPSRKAGYGGGIVSSTLRTRRVAVKLSSILYVLFIHHQTYTPIPYLQITAELLGAQGCNQYGSEVIVLIVGEDLG